MAPGFTSAGYQGATPSLADDYLDAADEIRSLIRPGEAVEMPPCL